MTVLQNLLALYTIIVFFNMFYSLSLWIKHRTLLHKAFFFVWAITILTFFMQGIFTQNNTQNNFLIVMGFSFTFFSNLPITFLISKTTNIEIPWSFLIILMAFAYVLSYIFYLNNLPLSIIAIPVAVGGAFPLLYAAPKALFLRWKQLTFSGKALCFNCLIIATHMLDYPIFRPNIDQPVFGLSIDIGMLGFTVVMITILALTVFGSSFILEITTRNQAKISAELDVARRIQMDILPNNPKIPNFELACYMQPAAEVGGDYYDVYSFDDLSWIFLGDVTGHGLGSGLVMFMVQSIISSVLHTKKDISPLELNKIANSILFHNLERLNEKRPMSILSMCLKKDGNFIVSGSNCNIYIYRVKTSEVEVVSINDFGLGIGFQNTLETTKSINSFKLNKNDLFFISTDGVTEAAQAGDYKNGMFGEERLISFIKNSAVLELNDIKEKLVSSLHDFTAGKFHDDITFLLARAKTI